MPHVRRITADLLVNASKDTVAFAILFLLRMVRRVQVLQGEGPDPVMLNNCFFAGPAEMMDRCRHLEDTSSRKHFPVRGIELIAMPHVEGARDHRHCGLSRMPVGRYPIVGRELQTKGEWTWLVGASFNQGHAGAKR